MKKYFITGLIILLPVVVTIAVIVFLVNLLTEPFLGIASSILKQFNLLNHNFLFLSPEQVLLYSSKLLILLFLIAVTLSLGAITRWFFINTLLRISDSILHKIPVVNTVYKTTQEIIKTILVSDKNSFKQVVMVAFPRPDVYVIGLVARESPKVCSDSIGEEMISVLVPTTPNPTTGFLMMFKKKELIYIDMKPEQAIKFVVSCGVITPDGVPVITKAQPFLSQ